MITVNILLRIFLFVLIPFFLFCAVKMDGAKVKIKRSNKARYGMNKAIMLPLTKNMAATTIFLWRLEIEISQTYQNIRDTQLFKDIINQP